MPANFDWHSEEDNSWEEPIYVSPESSGSRKKRRRWYLLIAAVIVLAVGFVAWRQLREYVDDTAEVTEQNVLASHELVTTAVSAADRELLVSLLSGRDSDWTAAQLSLLEEGLLFDRPSLNLTWQPATNQPPAIDVALSTDLRSAELVIEQPYQLFGGDDTVVLQQTLIYRQGDDRWLLSPPDDSFWGETIVATGSYISLSFPERDQEIGRRLAADIEALVGSACSTLLLSCPDTLHLSIDLTTDPAVWLAESSPEAALQGSRELVLPTPTLAGRPADVAGYRALYWAYGSRVLSALVTDLVGYSCCQHALFFRALLDKQLQQLGLREWPLSADDYRQALARQVTLAELEPLWRQNELANKNVSERPAAAGTADPDGWLAYAVVDFILQDQDGRPPVIEMQRQLLAAGTLREWTRELLSSGTAVDRAWLHYLQRQVVAGQSTPPVPWPDQDIALMCNDGTRGIANLYRLDLASGQWSLELGDRDFVVMMPLPDGRGLMLVEQFLTNDQLLSVIWQNGQETAVGQGELFYIPAGSVDPTGRLLAVMVIRPSSVTYGLLNLETCRPDDCPVLPLPGPPVWSPDGQRTLFSVGRQISIGDRRGQFVEHVGPGQEPVWLDNNTYGYLTLQAKPEFLAKSVGESDPDAGAADRSQVLVDESAIQAALSEVVTDTEVLESYQIGYARSSYQRPDQLFLIASQFPLQERPVLLHFDYQSGDLIANLITEPLADPAASDAALSPADLFNVRPETFSPDGRWLTLLAEGPPTSSFSPAAQVVFDTLTGQFQIATNNQASGLISLLGTVGWSADSQWLLRLVDGALVVTAPDENYEHFLTYPFANCTMAGWIAPPGSDMVRRSTQDVDGPARLNK